MQEARLRCGWEMKAWQGPVGVLQAPTTMTQGVTERSTFCRSFTTNLRRWQHNTNIGRTVASPFLSAACPGLYFDRYITS